MSPLAWGSQHAWLAESLTRVRQALGLSGPSASVATSELEELLRLEGDQPGWLRAAVDSADGARAGLAPLPLAAAADCLPVLSLRIALAAGLQLLHRMNRWRDALGEVCADMNAGMAIFRRDGLREWGRNERWDELLEQEPEREGLLRRITQLAQHAGSSSGLESLREDYVELELPGVSYRLVSRGFTAGTLLPDDAVLVLMNRLGPELPTTRELRVSFGLRGREPQVALLAAEGLSNDAIAEQLRLSSHTVRHYLERVLTRLGLHSRKALALHLMGAEREKPSQGSGWADR